MKAIPFPARGENSVPNPKFVKALQNGLTRLWDGVSSAYPLQGQNEYICNALRYVSDDLTKLISIRLDYVTYAYWLKENSHYCTEAEVQAGRKAWMLDLIEEFS